MALAGSGVLGPQRYEPQPLPFAMQSDSGIASEYPGSKLLNFYIEALPTQAPWPTAIVSGAGVEMKLTLEGVGSPDASETLSLLSGRRPPPPSPDTSCPWYA